VNSVSGYRFAAEDEISPYIEAKFWRSQSWTKRRTADRSGPPPPAMAPATKAATATMAIGRPLVSRRRRRCASELIGVKRQQR
jgi:hypothetical protein